MEGRAIHPEISLLSPSWLYPNRSSVGEWLENELKKCMLDLFSLLQSSTKPCLENPKLKIQDVEAFLQELKLEGFLLEQIQKNYQDYPTSKLTMKVLHERRETLRQEILDIDQVEALSTSLSFHSHLLLSPKDEAKLKESIDKNLRYCSLSKLPMEADLESWGQIVSLLSEILFTEKSIQLADRLSLSYESRIQSISELFNLGKKNMELSAQNLSENLSKVRECLGKDDLSKSKSWQSLPEFVKKTLQVKLSPEVMESLNQVEARFRNLSACMPDITEFESPLIKLKDFQEEQKQKLVKLKDTWRKQSRFPLQKEGSNVFQYGLRHFKLIWHRQLLEQNQIIRQQHDRKLDSLHHLLAKYSQKYGRGLDQTASRTLSFAQELVHKKPAKVKRLKSLEEKLVKLQTNHSIRLELSRRKEDALARWKSAFESRNLTPLEHSDPKSERVLKLGDHIRSLRSIHDQYKEEMSLFSSKLLPRSLVELNLAMEWFDRKGPNSNKIVQSGSEFEPYSRRKFIFD
jgi:hypothetical protein